MASSSPLRINLVTNESMENVSHDEYDDIDGVDPSSEGSNQSPMLMDGELDDDDIIFAPSNFVWYANGCALPGFKNDRVFSWELPITEGYASLANEQVLYIPQDSFERVLRNRNSIIIRTRHNGNGIKCDLITYEIQGGNKEMYVGKGWTEFVRANNLDKGDKLQFQISNPPDVLVVDIVRRRIT